MAYFTMDILRVGLTTGQDRKRIIAANDAGAIGEADTIFSTLFADDPHATGYRLRELRRSRSRVVHEAQKADAL